MTQISVCLTHYNRAHKLAATLESLAVQTRVPDEVLVWDDNSPTDPKEVVDRFRHRFSKLVFRRNQTNLGMPGNLNSVLAQARGQYVANLHDADIYDPHLLEKWARALDENPSAGMVFCGLRTLHKDTQQPFDLILDLPRLNHGPTFFAEKLVGNLSCPIWGTAMVRKSVHDQLLPLDPRFRNWSDIDYWMRISLHHDIAYVPEALITLDHSDTPERRFSWYRVLIVHEMYIANIKRHFARDPKRLSQALRRQSNFLRRRYPVLLGRAIRRGDFSAIAAGIRLLPQIFTTAIYRRPESVTDSVTPHRSPRP